MTLLPNAPAGGSHVPSPVIPKTMPLSPMAAPPRPQMPAPPRDETKRLYVRVRKGSRTSMAYIPDCAPPQPWEIVV